MKRRNLMRNMGLLAGGLLLPGCGSEHSSERYSQADKNWLAQQRRQEHESRGSGRHGAQVYRGYRGLARLPWFDLDDLGNLACTDQSIPQSIDMHCHLGMSVLLAPELDLHASTPRVHHLLDCDSDSPECALDLDVYANSNFTDETMRSLRKHTLAQGLWGSKFAESQTIPNLIAEMDAMRVQQSFILPIKMGLPFGDNLTERWQQSIAAAKVKHRLISGLSVHPRSSTRIEEMRTHAKAGSRLLKLHPTVQSFYPDDADMMPIYEEAQHLGMVIFFHGGRAGVEPESRQPYAIPRHYESVLANFPDLPVIFGHAGARDGAAMLDLAIRYDNAWLGIHGQGVSALDEVIRITGGKRLLFGTDWPFYHIGMSLAKVLLCTESAARRPAREKILRSNALKLLSALG